MTNFGLADSFLRFIESQNDFKEVVTSFQKCMYFPQCSRVRTIQLRDTVLDHYLCPKDTGKRTHFARANWAPTF